MAASSRGGGGVGAVTIAEGSIEGEVASSSGGFYTVALEAAPVPPTVWARVVREARGRPEREQGVEGTAQSVHLAHWMETELEQPLVPPAQGDAPEVHVPRRAAVSGLQARRGARVRRRGRDRPGSVAAPALPRAASPTRRVPRARRPVAGRTDPCAAARSRPLPPGAVVKRLGRSGIRVGDVDLADALAPAYRAFAEHA